MRLLGVATLALGFCLSANAKIQEHVSVTCKISGDALEQHRNAGDSSFPSNAVVGEFQLIEMIDDTDVYSPSKLKIVKSYYDATGFRKRVVGAPLQRVGYSNLDGTVTFSYTVFQYGDTRNFQISTNGQKSVISYSQTPGSRRDFQESISCKVQSTPALKAKPLNMANLSNEEKVSAINSMIYKRYRTADLAKDLGKAKTKKVMKKLLKMVNNHDFEASNPGTQKVKWSKSTKCGKLSKSRYRYNKTVLDYKGNIIGIVLNDLKCSEKINYHKKKWDPNTGKRVADQIRTEYVYIEPVYLDTDGNILNENTKNNKLRIETSNW